MTASCAKTATGIQGLDEITGGGLPEGRPTLVCGGPGSGKTLLGLTFLVNGAVQFDEPGVLMTFEENAEEIASDVASLGFDLPQLVEAQKLAIDYVRVERSEIEETGEYDLEGLFVRLDYAIRSVGRQARRPRHHRVALRRAQGRRRPPGGAAAPVPLAEGQGRHRPDHRRARRRVADQAGPRGIRVGRRDPARSPRPRSGLDAPPARGQVPRLAPRHERVPVPHRQHRHQRPAGVVDGAGAPRVAGTHLHRAFAARRDARRQGVLPRQHGAGHRRGGHRKDEPRGALSRCRVPARRALPLLSLRRVAAAAPAKHALDRHRPRALGRGRPAEVSRRSAVALRARTASRDDAPARGRLQADRDGDRPGDQPDDGRAPTPTSRRCSPA